MLNVLFHTLAIALTVTTALMLPLEGTANAQDEDLEQGKKLYEECGGCHALRENDVGPRHCGVVGRPAASVPDYTYSLAMQESGIVWDEEHLNEFLKSPFTYVIGTQMGYFGIHDDNDRAAVIAYLKTLTPDSPVCRDPE